MSTVFAQDVSDLVRGAAAQLREGKLEDGERLLQAALRLAPHDENALRLNGMLALERRDAAGAAEIFARLAACPTPRADVLRGLGRARREQGDLQGAIEAYERALEISPAAADVMVSLGIALKQRGDAAAAEHWFRRAAQTNPALAEAHHSLGLLLAAQGRVGEALECWQRAVAAQPALVAAWLALGTALREAGRLGEALDAYRSALRFAPGRALVHLEIGLLEQRLLGAAEALPHFQRAVELDAASAEARNNLGMALAELGRYDEAVAHLAGAAAAQQHVAAFDRWGDALRLADRFEEALAAYDRGIALDPLFAPLHMHRGAALYQLKRWDESEQSSRRYIELAGENEEVISNLAAIHLDRGLFEEALGYVRAAAEKNPLSAPVQTNLGVALYFSRRPREALEALERAIALDPQFATAQMTCGMARLMLGDYERGWEQLEWRWKAHAGLAKGELKFPQPRWSGESLRGKTILLTGEQGLGDVLQFARYAPLVAARGARVLLLAPAPLVRLMRSVPAVERVFSPYEPLEGFDVHCPLMSLPRVMGTRLSSVPAQVPYLRADPQDVRAWAERVAAACGGTPGLKVGLVWSGDPRPETRDANLTDARRSLRLEQYAPLARVPGIHWFSLQKGAPAAQAKAPPEGMRLIDLMDEVRDFADTAALVENLDLVISVDTSVVHLVGGLARPVWMLSRFDGCWRWMLERTDSPWYPTLRIFRQHAPRDWTRAVGELAQALAEKAA